MPNSPGGAFFFFDSDFYFQSSDPFRSLTPEPLGKHHVTKDLPKEEACVGFITNVNVLIISKSQYTYSHWNEKLAF